MTSVQSASKPGPPPAGAPDGRRGELVSRLVRQALEELANEPPMAVADWIAQVVDPQRPSTIVLICDPATPLAALRQAKDLYKLLRVLAQDQPLRRIGRRMYAAAIAAAIVHHDTRISDQSDRALARAFHFLSVDDDVPEPIRELVNRASARLPDVISVDEGAVVMPTLIDTALNKATVPPRKADEANRPKVRKPGGIRRRQMARESRRLHGEYDPVFGSSFQRRQAYCQACRSIVEIRRKLPPRSLHLWVSMLTLGLWLPVWGLLEFAAHLRSWRCVNCRRRIYEALIS